MADGLTHFDEAPSRQFDLGHLRSRWTFLGEAAGSVGVGLRRMEVAPGGWTTPVHDHGRGEEIFYVLSGEGLSWQRGRTASVRAGDCIVYHPRRGEHALQAGEAGLDLLAFGPRMYDEALRLPRLDASLVNGRAIASTPGTIDGLPFQFVREAALGPPEVPASPEARPPTIVNLADVEAQRVEHGRVARVRRRLSAAAGSQATGLQHVVVDPGCESTAMHCHSLEEELFVVLEGEGVLGLGTAEYPVRAGSVVSRPAATGVAHVLRAGESALTLLAYGPREANDICWYPRSAKVALRGVGVMFRVEPIGDYWDGED